VNQRLCELELTVTAHVRLTCDPYPTKLYLTLNRRHISDLINVADRKLYWIVSSLVPPCHACHCNSILHFFVWISYYCVLRWWKDLGILPSLTWASFLQGVHFISNVVLCKQ